MALRVGFIGTGVMGAPMAGHLMTAGHQLTVFNRTMSKAQELLSRGATAAATPAEVARDVEFVFINVPDSPDVREVCLGEHGIVKTVRKGTIVIDHSTISPAVTREVAAELAKVGAEFLDAPVSGGDIGAKNATLSIMVGGAEAALEKAMPLLRAMGKTITHTGPVGTGQLTKLVNQILVSVTNLATCEALAFAKKSGLDLQKTIEAVAGGAAGSWQLSNLGPRMVKGDFRPGFTIDLQQKDLRLVMETGEQAEISLLATALVHQLFSAAQSAGYGREGTQALYRVVDGLSQRH